jgi:hypothetical protein
LRAPAGDEAGQQVCNEYDGVVARYGELRSQSRSAALLHRALGRGRENPSLTLTDTHRCATLYDSRAMPTTSSEKTAHPPRPYITELVGGIVLYAGISALAQSHAGMMKGIRDFHPYVAADERSVFHFYHTLWPFLILTTWLWGALRTVHVNPADLANPEHGRSLGPHVVIKIAAFVFATAQSAAFLCYFLAAMLPLRMIGAVARSLSLATESTLPTVRRLWYLLATTQLVMSLLIVVPAADALVFARPGTENVHKRQQGALSSQLPPVTDSYRLAHDNEQFPATPEAPTSLVHRAAWILGNWAQPLMFLCFLLLAHHNWLCGRLLRAAMVHKPA